MCSHQLGAIANFRCVDRPTYHFVFEFVRALIVAQDVGVELGPSCLIKLEDYLESDRASILDNLHVIDRILCPLLANDSLQLGVELGEDARVTDFVVVGLVRPLRW